MIKFAKKTQPAYILIDFFFIFISFFLPYILRYNHWEQLLTNIKFSNLREYSFVFIFELILLFITFKRKRLYCTDRNLTIPKELRQVITQLLYVNIIIGSMVFFAQYKFFSRIVFVGNFVLLCIFLSSWRIFKRLIVRKLIRGGYNNTNVLIIGTGKIQHLVLEEIKRQPHMGLKVVGLLGSEEKCIDEVPVLGDISNFVSVAKKYFIEEVIITVSFTQKAISDLIEQAQKMRLGVRIVPEQLEGPLPILGTTNLGVIPLLTYQTQKKRIFESRSKRLLDITVSLFLIIALFVPCLIIALLIKIESPGSVFYIQKRFGFKGKKFHLYKFRSMRNNADQLKNQLLSVNESKDNIMFKIKKDPRITKIGTFLRKYSLDELPQFLNVLRGHMSLVGPRPPLADEVKKYTHNHIERLSVKPGITGLSQIRGRSDLTFSRWVKWDVWYINNWSLGLDIKILLKTIPVVIKGKGAY